MHATARRQLLLTVVVFVYVFVCLATRTLTKSKSSTPARRLGVPQTSTPVVASAQAIISDRRKLRKWQSSLFMRTMSLYRNVESSADAAVEPQGGRRFDLFSPFITCPNGQPPVRYGGGGDGGKMICGDLLASPDCVVFSLGSNNDFTFEVDILARTKCTVITFDCTVDGKNVHPRHKFVNKCLRGRDKKDADPAHWTTLELAMADLGIERLDLLKIDIEGAEYDVLGSWSQNSTNLPRQVAMEMHYDDIYYGTPAFKNRTNVGNLVWPLHVMRLSDLALFMSHLAGAGYGIVSREDNIRSPHCSEFTLVRV